MRYYHLYADDAGESHWRNVEVVLKERTFAPPAQGIHVSEPESVTSMMFLELPAGWNEPVHPELLPVLGCDSQDRPSTRALYGIDGDAGGAVRFSDYQPKQRLSVAGRGSSLRRCRCC